MPKPESEARTLCHSLRSKLDGRGWQPSRICGEYGVWSVYAHSRSLQAPCGLYAGLSITPGESMITLAGDWLSLQNASHAPYNAAEAMDWWTRICGQHKGILEDAGAPFSVRIAWTPDSDPASQIMHAAQVIASSLWAFAWYAYGDNS